MAIMLLSESYFSFFITVTRWQDAPAPQHTEAAEDFKLRSLQEL